MFSILKQKIDQLTREADKISAQRKNQLRALTNFVQDKIRSGKPPYLNFICTHNSRRSQFAQIWAQTAAHFYKVQDVNCFSGGTEATAFNPRALKAMEGIGFNFTKIKDGDNPIYEVRVEQGPSLVVVFSKKYDDPFNPGKDFAAIMTCSDADVNCPLVLGAASRITLSYDDPKEFDGSKQEKTRYTECADQMGREILYAFAQIKI